MVGELTKEELEARLKDSLAFNLLLYEDLIKHDIRTPARRIVGTFLHSNGFQESTNHLEKVYRHGS